MKNKLNKSLLYFSSFLLLVSGSFLVKSLSARLLTKEGGILLFIIVLSYQLLLWSKRETDHISKGDLQ